MFKIGSRLLIKKIGFLSQISLPIKNIFFGFFFLYFFKLFFGKKLFIVTTFLTFIFLSKNSLLFLDPVIIRSAYLYSKIENVINTAVEGYRASCFSLNRERLDQVQKAGYFYDSSRIDFGLHPLYENINMDGYELVRPNIFKNNDFFEFQVTTNLVYGKSIPISGGGYLRLLPWYISQRLIKPYLNQGELFILYIHPFELSEKENPPFPASTKWHNKLRFGLGRSSVAKKLSKLINLLKNNGYMFKTFSSFRKELLSQ